MRGQPTCVSVFTCRHARPPACTMLDAPLKHVVIMRFQSVCTGWPSCIQWTITRVLVVTSNYSTTFICYSGCYCDLHRGSDNKDHGKCSRPLLAWWVLIVHLRMTASAMTDTYNGLQAMPTPCWASTGLPWLAPFISQCRAVPYPKL
jgi:hypothetical protein